MAPVQTSAVLLRNHDYGDSSKILRFYTRDHGMLSVVAKGVRGRSGKGTTTLASYASGELAAFVRPHRDLHTMKDFHCTRLRARIPGDVLRFAGAAAAAELVLAHVEQEAHEALFLAVEGALDALDEAPHEARSGTVLAALWSVVEALGFAPQLDSCVRCHRMLSDDEMGRFDHGAGGMRCHDCMQDAAGPRLGPIARGQVALLLQGKVPEDFEHARRHLALVSEFASCHLVSRPLKAMGFLADALPPDSESPHG